MFTDATLASTTERHQLDLPAPRLQPMTDLPNELSRLRAAGAVLELATGLPYPPQLTLLDQVLRTGRRAWVFWPSEHAVECMDEERLDSLRRHVRTVKWLERVFVPIDRLVTIWNRAPTGLRWIYRGEFPVRRSDILVNLTLLSLRAQPVALSDLSGTGVYIRTDFWNGGPDDEAMTRVVGQLGTIGRIVCLTARPDASFAWSKVARLRQIVMDPPRQTAGEDAIVLAPAHYLPIIKSACQALTPAYLYDRGTAGAPIAAELSQHLQIPLVFEYRGHAAVIHEALNGGPPFYPELYEKAEELSLRQASVVVVSSEALRDELRSRGIDSARVLVAGCHETLGSLLAGFVEEQTRRVGSAARIVTVSTGDAYKDQVQAQWNINPVGSQHARAAQPHTLDWFLEVERHRYHDYAPWMPSTMEFAGHAGEDVLEIGGGLGTDLAQFAANGARVTDVDLAAGHLQLAEENFQLRGLDGRFVHHDAESLPFHDHAFDLVYSNGVLHHTPNTAAVVAEIGRVLRPGGRVIVMLYAEHSFHYWRKLVWLYGVKQGLLNRASMGEIMSRTVERSANEARPLVKVYTKARAKALFRDFDRVEMVQRQLGPGELPPGLRWSASMAERLMGWNLILKARKPR